MNQIKSLKFLQVAVAAFFTALLSLAACSCSLKDNAKGFIPAPPDYTDKQMWFTQDGDSDGTGADVFYVVSTW